MDVCWSGLTAPILRSQSADRDQKIADGDLFAGVFGEGVSFYEALFCELIREVMCIDFTKPGVQQDQKIVCLLILFAA